MNNSSNLLFCTKHFYKNDYHGNVHSHPCYEIVYYCEGEGTISFSGKEYAFSKDTFMICGPEIKHIEQGSSDTVVLYIGFQWLGDIALPEGLFQEKDFGIKEYLDKIHEETQEWSKYSRRLINLYCSIISVKIAKGYRKIVKGKNIDKNLDATFDNIVEYISANFTRADLNISDLAQMAGYSYDHFRKLFFKRFNMTVNDFILRKRIELADLKLREGELLIKEIAFECGFSSVAQFCVKYRQVTGQTPKERQKQMAEASGEIPRDVLSKDKKRGRNKKNNE